MKRLAALVSRQWYQGGWLAALLRPWGAVYCQLSRLRAGLYEKLHKRRRGALPALVVGNLTAGGSGKTPLVLALAEYLHERGWQPALVSRGYRAHPPRLPYPVQPGDEPGQAGDEPLFLARRSGLPVVIGPDRLADIEFAARRGCDVAVLDDGFQHLALLPELSLIVVDGARGFGNGRCLPAGPLREPLAALTRADALVIHGTSAPLPPDVAGKPVFSMTLQATGLVPVAPDLPAHALGWLRGRRVHAVAGIGHPERFFRQLEALGARPVPHPFPDHHVFVAADFARMQDAPVVMTEKDAVKCRQLSLPDAWALRVEARLPAAFWRWLDAQLQFLGRSRDH